MLLAVDIGNTNITFGIFKGRRLVKRFCVGTKDILRRRGGLSLPYVAAGITDAVICSVVPQATQKIDSFLTRLLGKPPYIIGKNIKVPIKNLYRKPKQLGQDRLVNAYAGAMLYGTPLVVVDFGTAITFDIVSRKKEYLGGMILPGLKLALEALSGCTALLPKVRLKAPREFIAKSTQNSMLSGVIYGFSALTEKSLEKIKAKIGKGARVIGTGGNIGLISKYCHSFDVTDINLTLKGLKLLYFFSQKNSQKNP